jgi:SAM-dependent methyltransferase
MDDDVYAAKLAQEKQIFKDQVDVNALPEIFHFWSNKYLRPMLEEYGAANPDQFFAKCLQESAIACAAPDPAFISIGAGNCDTEIRVAGLLKDAGLAQFTIECMDINPHMLERGRQMAEQEGVSGNVSFVEGDFNSWEPRQVYAGVMANQSLHHVVNLEGLFNEIRCALDPRGCFVISDMIGRNGHQRWPEALAAVHRFWHELPPEYRYNHQLDRYEELYENWDCSGESFEGIRAQEILPLLLDRFHFRAYIGFANVIDVFIDRAFGHNFKADREWDRDFIDRVHAFDERALLAGNLTPTHMLAVLSSQPGPRRCSRGLTPERSVRWPTRLAALSAMRRRYRWRST